MNRYCAAWFSCSGDIVSAPRRVLPSAASVTVQRPLVHQAPSRPGRGRKAARRRRGPPRRSRPVGAVADALKFVHKYTSGVIAWARGPADRRRDRGRARQVREDGLDRTGARPLRLDGGRAPRAGRRRSRARPRRPVRPGDGQEPQHRAARLAEDLRPATRRLQPPARLDPARRPGAGQDAATRPSRLPSTRRTCGPGWRSRPTSARSSGTTWCRA